MASREPDKPPGLVNKRGQRGTAKYRCPRCGEKWKMNNSTGSPKTCEECCEKEIQPYDFIPNPKRMFGEFHCSCGRHWSSGYAWTKWDGRLNKWVDNWQHCRDCEEEVYPSSLQPLRYKGGSSMQKPHDSVACEMCQKHGDCRNLHTTGVEEDEWDDSASIRSESSSVSGIGDDQNLSDGTPVNSDEETDDDYLSSHLKQLNMKQ